MQGIVDALKKVRMGDAIPYRNLTVFPLCGDAATDVDLRLSGNDLTGAALAADNRIIHLSAFMTGN